jgi:sporulation protein YlmC with PRC-barrel domain
VLQTIRKVEGCQIVATDGEIGRIDDIYFDDDQWVVRYLIVTTGDWLDERKVLISPYAVKVTDWTARATIVNLTREQVARSPGIDTDKPVSRQHESEYHNYYGFQEYWPYATYWAWGAMPRGHQEQSGVRPRSSPRSRLRAGAARALAIEIRSIGG